MNPVFGDLGSPAMNGPVCSGESPLKEAGNPQPVAGTQGRSRSLPNDRPVIHGRGTEPPGFPDISSISISHGWQGAKSACADWATSVRGGGLCVFAAVNSVAGCPAAAGTHT